MKQREKERSADSKQHAQGVVLTHLARRDSKREVNREKTGQMIGDTGTHILISRHKVRERLAGNETNEEENSHANKQRQIDREVSKQQTV